MRNFYLFALLLMGSVFSSSACAELKEVFSNTYYKPDGMVYLKALQGTQGDGGIVIINYVPKSPEEKRKLERFYDAMRDLVKKHSSSTLGFLSQCRVQLIGSGFRVDNPFGDLATVSGITLSTFRKLSINWWNRDRVFLPAGKPVSIELLLGLKPGEAWRWYHPDDVVIDLFVGQSIGDILDEPIQPAYRLSERNVTVYVRIEDSKFQVYVFPHNLSGLETIENMTNDVGLNIDLLTPTRFTAYSVKVYPTDWIKMYGDNPRYTDGLMYETRIYPSETHSSIRLTWFTVKR